MGCSACAQMRARLVDALKKGDARTAARTTLDGAKYIIRDGQRFLAPKKK